MDKLPFSEDGHLIIPVTQWKRETAPSAGVRYVVDEAYCPRGCNILDAQHLIHGYPGLRIGFRRPGAEGELVLSPVQGDFTRILLRGELAEGVKDDLYCPHCGAPFAKLVNCQCAAGGEMIAIGVTPALDFNNAIAFCNVTGCRNQAFVRSGVVLRNVWLEGTP